MRIRRNYSWPFTAVLLVFPGSDKSSEFMGMLPLSKKQNQKQNENKKAADNFFKLVSSFIFRNKNWYQIQQVY